MSNAPDERGPVRVNGRTYAWPTDPLVVVCIDGSEPGYEGSDGGGYIERAVADGCMPFAASMIERGTRLLADCVVPSFTNPNNLSIVTGVPPSVHGICGNYFYDREQDAEVMMNEPRLLRAQTVFSAFAARGARVAVITAKDKLRALLGHGLPTGDSGSVCFSAEKADASTRAENGIDGVPALAGMAVPEVYSAELSEFVFAAGVRIMQRLRPDLMYLSTTDYVQHKHAPGTPAANAFYAMMDRYWAELDALGCTLALTADHGMKAKHDSAGRPCIVFLQSLLDEWLGVGATRVILPITDPYVVHHGALGGFATAYVPEGTDGAVLRARLEAVPGIQCALDRDTACRRFDLPPDRVGDLVVISEGGWVIGASPDRHDLSGLDAPLRSHGGLSEGRVPLLINRPTRGLSPERGLRNYDILDLALNHAA
jgi:phosphonoacetate hydrolase